MIEKSAGEFTSEFTTADFTSGPAAIPVSPTQRFHPYSGFAWGDVTATSPPFNMLLRAPSNTPPGERSGIPSGGALQAWGPQAYGIACGSDQLLTRLGMPPGGLLLP